MIINRCWNCMEDLGGQHICPSCGFNPDGRELPPYVLKPNTILHGKYLVGNVLGQGGFGITYIGFDLTLELKVAIKEYFPFNMAARNHTKSNSLSWHSTELQDEGWRSGCSQFLSEARKMAKINAIPEIVSVRDTFEENKTAYIVMDYVPGLTLKDYVRKNGCFTFSDCVNLLLPLIEGLDKIHRQGLVHRDISPDNLMLTPNGKLYLLDLGAAKDMNRVSDHSEVVAKKGFSPIEQYTNDGNIGAWTDVYALAASIYYCVFGKVVPPAVDRLDHDALDFSGKVKTPLTSGQVAVLKKGLAVQREMRYQSAIEFWAALRDVTGGKTPKSKKKIGIISGIVAAVAAMAAGIGILVTTTPWLPTVESVGRNDANFLTGSYYVEIEEEYIFFVDLDGSLRLSTFDEDDETFYVDISEVVYAQNDEIENDGVSELILTEDKLYVTYYGGEGKDDYIIEMNHDGSRQRRLQKLQHDNGYMQYVKLSNGKEYLYYVMDDGSSEDEYHLHLYRYDLQEDNEENVIADDLSWYTVHGKYVYYTVWDEDEEVYLFKQAALNGKNEKLLDDVHNFAFGFYENDRLYMYQLTDAAGSYRRALVSCTDDGKPVEEGQGNFSVDWMVSDEGKWTIGGGWIFYCAPGTDELYRMRLDGSDKSLIHSGYSYNNLCYYNNWLYFQDGFDDEEEGFVPSQAYTMKEDGSNIVSFDLDSGFKTTENGIRYTISNGEVRLLGYDGDETDVVVPNEIDGYPLNESASWADFPSGLTLYKMIYDSELTYTEDSNGITITGYDGSLTGTYSNVAIPSEINGVAVVKIEDGVFSGWEFKGVYLPNQLREVGVESFEDCSNLRHVVFPDTLLEIGNRAFRGCSFAGEEIRFSEGFEYMGLDAFNGCTPYSIYFPASFARITYGFLNGCGGEYIIDSANETFVSVDGIVYTKDGRELVAFPAEYSGSFSVPGFVEVIQRYAFAEGQIEEVILSDNVREIGYGAFYGCGNLYGIYIPKSVTQIRDSAFDGTMLAYVMISEDCIVEDFAFGSDVFIDYYELYEE